MYELTTPNNLTNRTNQPFLNNELEEEGPVQTRQCTDIVCLILFLLSITAFIIILIYSLIAGTPRDAISIHNPNGIACYQDTTYILGFFPFPGQPKNAICVDHCPQQNQVAKCLIDSTNCVSGTFTSNYNTFQILDYCIPDLRGSGTTSYFDYNVVVQWIFDINGGYLILIGSAIAAIILVLIYACFLRCFTGCILYLSLAVVQIFFIGIGILIICEAAGVAFMQQSVFNLAKLSSDQLYIVGSILIAIGLIFLVLIVCIWSKLQLGVKIVETAAIFLSQRFYMAIMPIISTIFFFATIAALCAGGYYIYGTGSRTLTSPDAFFKVNFNSGLIILYIVFAATGLWMVIWTFYSNTFVIMSAAAIWYYQQDSPLCTSLFRLIRYHTGSLAFASLLFGILFILRLIAKFLRIRNQQSDNKILNACINLVTCCFVIIDQLLKFLSDGVFVQIAMRSTNYCVSTLEAFKLLASNPLRIAVTGAISYMVAILGVLFCIASICTPAYFIQLKVSYFSNTLTDPVPMTVISGFIVAVISGAYLSVLADSADSLIQCYLIEDKDSKAKGNIIKFAPEHLKLILEDHMGI